MHLNDGQLRAYLDDDLAPPERARAAEHMAKCQTCRDQREALSGRAAAVAARMASLDPSPLEARLPSSSAYQHFREHITRKEQQSMLQKLFSHQYRLVWAALGVIAILGIALAFPGVRAIANSFLGLFRVEQFTVVQVNPGDLPEQLGSSSQFEQLIAKNVQLEELGDPAEVSSAKEAGGLAGIPVRLPSALEDQPQLMVQPGARASFEIDLPLVQALLNEIGQEDIQLPSSLDGATVEMELPASVTAGYGDCHFDSEAARESGIDPDDPRPRMPDCITLVQMPSPTISAPPGLDIAEVGEAFLQVMGMSPEEAAQFSQTVDWTTTLVIPIPRYGTNFEEVSVDGVKGTLILQNFDNHAGQYLLIWVKNDILYALTGQGDGSEALTIANSIK